MSNYEFPELPSILSKKSLTGKKKSTWMLAGVFLGASIFGLIGGFTGMFLFSSLGILGDSIPNIIQERIIEKEYIPQTSQEQKIIEAVKSVSPAVVSIVITKDVPILEQFFEDPFGDIFGVPSPFQIPQIRQRGVEKQEIGAGSGFIVSTDGLVLTNKHVVLDEDAEYTVFLNNGKAYPTKVLAKDPVQDLAILQIEPEQEVNDDGQLVPVVFPSVKLGDSDRLQIGQTVIAIGNALAEFRNTVSVGVISGLGRTITASGGNFVETLEDVLQTDAAINKGNSGGPILNLAGEVIGINTATILNAQSIGFAIPVNKAKRAIRQVQETGKIVYPFLGVRYTLVTPKLQTELDLPVSYGAFLRDGEGGLAVTPGSAAGTAGLKVGDVILEINGEKITLDNSLAKIIQKYEPQDEIVIKVMRGDEEKIFRATLGERSE
ncbi:MAG: trypsin-like peptidase domain-containing protein [Patescibacteria group bacterium]|nr:trypsin-like peptidase domain-containing protein [Patescibacteria group bacterium]